MQYNYVHLAIDLLLLYNDLTDPFEVQNKLEYELDMDVHINEILSHEKFKEVKMAYA